MRSIALSVGCVLIGTALLAGKLNTSDHVATGIPEIKTTPYELYLTSHEAHSIVTAKPETLFIDVRDQLEVSLSGHPEQIDAVVPIMVQSDEFDEELLEWALVDNPKFLEAVNLVVESNNQNKDDLIILTCGAGKRSAIAARALHAAGYTNVWHIPDGYPGDEKPGLNRNNAWLMAGLPWSHGPAFGIAVGDIAQ